MTPRKWNPSKKTKVKKINTQILKKQGNLHRLEQRIAELNTDKIDVEQEIKILEETREKIEETPEKTED